MDRVIFLTGRCSHDCWFCSRDEWLVERPRGSVEAEIDGCEEAGVERIVFSGGEPTLHADFFHLVRYAADKGRYFILVQSNAMVFDNPARARDMKEAGAGAVLASLHSHLEKVSDELTRCPGGWKRTMAAVRNLDAAGVTVNINIVANSVNFRQLPEFVEFVSRELPFVKAVTLSVVTPDAAAYKNKWVVPKHSDISPYLIRAHELCMEKGLMSRNPDCGAPLCFLKGVEQVSEDYLRAKAGGMSEAEKQYWDKVCGANRVKSGICRKCVYDGICSGVWKRYAVIHGLRELRPVLDGRLEP